MKIYPLYKQQHPIKGGKSIIKYQRGRKTVFTNADVVPYNYNKYLLYKYKYHTNIKYCHSVGAIKYLFKHICKEGDMATITIDEANKGELEIGMK